MGDQVRSSADSLTRAPRRRRGPLALAAVVLASSVAVGSPGTMTVRAAHPTYVFDEVVVPGAQVTGPSDINASGTALFTVYFPDSRTRALTGNPTDGYTDIGDLGGGSVIPRDINDAGQIMGHANVLAGVYPDHTFIWTAAGGMVDIGGLNGFAGAGGFALNDSGMVVGGSGGTSFAWTAAGGMVDIGIPGHFTYATDVNNAGTAIIRDVSAGRSYVRTADGTLTDLGSLPGGETMAIDINDNGMVSGVSGAPSGLRHPFVWTASGGIVDLDPTNAFGITFGQGTDINNNGEVVGRLDLANGDAPAFYWSEGTGMVLIDGLGTSNRETEADGINEIGQVVGYSYTAANVERGFVWTLADGILELDVRDAYDINNAGQILGVRVDPDDGTTRGRLLAPFVDPDGNGNGVDDAIEVIGPPLGFDDGDTSGSITASNGYDIAITDATAPDGVRIVVSGSGTGKATFSVCGFTLKVTAGSDVVVTCGSIIVEVQAGSAEVEAGDDIVVTVPAGGSAEVDEAVDGSVVVTNLGDAGAVDVTVLVGGTSTTVAAGLTTTFSAADTTPPTVVCDATPTFLLHQPGALVWAQVSDSDSGPLALSATAAANTNAVGAFVADVRGLDNAGNETTVPCPYAVTYRFTGFAAPIDNLPTVNSAKAGQTVPVKWKIADFHGVGVADPSSFVAVTSSSGACSLGSPFDAVETYWGNSGLQYLGNGSWQFNWKTPKSYAGLCRTLHLTLADAGDHTAAFSFK